VRHRVRSDAVTLACSTDVKLESGTRRGGSGTYGQDEVVERFDERFGANGLDGAFASFAPECIAVGLSGPLDNSAHHAAAPALKKAMPDCHMELVRILEMDDEIDVTGRLKGTHTGDLSTPLGPVARQVRNLTCSSLTTSASQTKRSSSARSFGTGWE
jgi:hypothetical protein